MTLTIVLNNGTVHTFPSTAKIRFNKQVLLVNNEGRTTTHDIRTIQSFDIQEAEVPEEVFGV